MGMNRTFKATVAALTLAISYAGSVAAGPFEDGAAAYKKGDYATALRLIGPIAEEGNAAAQFNLGVMHQFSYGVPQDNEAAVSWYRKAAEQGLAEAQYNLGVMYANGEGVPQDYAAAHMWSTWLRRAETETTGNRRASRLSTGHARRRDCCP
jgi:uncharacterized protein